MTSPYMPLYIADYMADTAHLDTIEHGAYLLLIMTYWQRGKPLLSERLANVCRLDSESFEKIRPVLEKLFTVDHENGLWRHKRIDQELAKFAEKSEKARKSGALGAQKRAEQTLSKRQANAEQTLSYTDTDTDTDTDIINLGLGMRSDVPSARPKEKKQSVKGTRLDPSIDCCPEEWGQWAQSEYHLTVNEVIDEFDKFRDYWISRAGSGGVKLDWQATWRNWVRKSQEYKANQTQGGYKK